MSHPPEPTGVGRRRRLFRATVLSPLRRQTYLNLLYLLLAFPLGIFYVVFLVAGLSLGVSLAILLVGIPILLFVLGTCHVLAAFERVIARRLLSVEIDSPGFPFLEPDDELERLRALVFGLGTYMSLCFLATKFVVGLVAFVLVTTLLATSVALVLTPLYYDRPTVGAGIVTGGEPIQLTPSLELPWQELLVGLEFAVVTVEWQVTSLPGAFAASAVGVVFLLVSLAICNAFARLVGQFSRVFLGPFGDSPSAQAAERVEE